jgi:hypothetical protein
MSRGKSAPNDNRVIGMVVLVSSSLAAFSFRTMHSWLTPLYFTPRRVYKIYYKGFKRGMRELCREEMKPYFDVWRKGL